MRVKPRARVKRELTREQKDGIREAFNLFDTDRTGTIDSGELKVALRAMGFDVSKADVTEIMKDYDRDGKGELKLQDFTDIMTSKLQQRDPVEEMIQAFQLYDEDGTGKITLSNIRKVSEAMGEKLTDEELQAMIDEFDVDKDGAINQQEFLKIMKEANLC